MSKHVLNRNIMRYTQSSCHSKEAEVIWHDSATHQRGIKMQRRKEIDRGQMHSGKQDQKQRVGFINLIQSKYRNTEKQTRGRRGPI